MVSHSLRFAGLFELVSLALAKPSGYSATGQRDLMLDADGCLAVGRDHPGLSGPGQDIVGLRYG